MLLYPFAKVQWSVGSLGNHTPDNVTIKLGKREQNIIADKNTYRRAFYTQFSPLNFPIIQIHAQNNW